MPGKFINEITGDTPAKDDLAVFFDKSKNSTAQATIAEIVNAGLDLAAGAKGQVPTIDVKVDAATSSLVNILTWGAGGGVDFKGTPTRPPAATDETLTNDPVSGLVGKTTLQQLVVAGGATILQPGTAVNTALVWNDTAGKWEPARAVGEAKNINGGATGELPFQLNTHVTAWIPLGNAGQVLTIGDIGTAGNSFIAPMWNDPVKELPAFTIADKGKQLTVKADGKATEWVEDAKELPTLTAGLDALQIKADKSGVEWTSSVNMATNLKGGYTSGAFFPVNDQKTNTTRFVDAPTFRHLAGVPEGYTFDQWAPVNRQIGEYYPEFQLAQTRMSAEALSTPGAAPMTKMDAAGFPGGYKYSAAIQVTNGKVILIPWQAAKAAYCQQDGTGFTEFGLDLTSNAFGAYTSAILLADGRVLCVPASADNLLLIDPNALTTKKVTGLGVTQYKFIAATLLPDGKALLAPGAATKFKLFDPATDTLADIGPDYGAASGKFGAAQLLPNGKVFVVPASRAGGVLFDPTTSTFTDVLGGHTGGYSACLLPDGKVFMPGATSRVYDYSANTVTDLPAAISLTGYIFCSMLPNGRVMVWSSGKTPKLYKPDTGTVSDLSFTIPASAYGSSVMLRNGNIFLGPYASTSAGIISAGFGKDIPTNYWTSPFYCKTL